MTKMNAVRCEKFAAWLKNAMYSKGWNQSELARQAGIPRDSISVYVRAKSFPTTLNLNRILDLFKAKHSDIFPNETDERAGDGTLVDRIENVFEFRVISDAPGMAHIRLNRVLSLATAIRIADLVDKDVSKSS